VGVEESEYPGLNLHHRMGLGLGLEVVLLLLLSYDEIGEGAHLEIRKGPALPLLLFLFVCLSVFVRLLVDLQGE